MVAFSYSPGCDINTRHQPNADTFYTLVDIFAHLPVAVAHDVKNVSECYIVKKKKNAHIRFYLERQMKDMLSTCMPDLRFAMHAERVLFIYHTLIFIPYNDKIFPYM